VIASISNFADVGDITTLANPDVVDGIRRQVYKEKTDRGEAPRELTAKELEEIQSYGRVD
jgi:acetyl-CoA synthetase